MKDLIEKTKVQNIIQQRKRKRISEEEGSASNANDNARPVMKASRKFKQTTVLGKLYDENDYKLNNSVLKTIFSKNAE